MERDLITETEAVENSQVKEKRRLPVLTIVLAFALLLGFLGFIGWGLFRSMRGTIIVGDPVPSFSITTFEGQTFNTANYAGKVIVLNFWASWCKPCEQEAKELEEAYQMYRGTNEVIFLGLAYVDTEPKALAYLERFGITYPNGPDLATRVSQIFRVRGVPETFIIDRDGNLAYFKAGPFFSLREITLAVDSVLSK
jgi:cytochrome c biogenesis protein CcmG, thiol:disulfide interchange protein DsbE